VIAPGTYTVTNTAIGDGGIGCPPPSSVVTYPTPPPDAAVEGGLPGPTCTTPDGGHTGDGGDGGDAREAGDLDSGTCATTIQNCVGTEPGGTKYTSTTSQTVANGLPTGMTSYAITYSDGGVVTACSYTYAWTPGGEDSGADAAAVDE
jgi:hypothetical protein